MKCRPEKVAGRGLPDDLQVLLDADHLVDSVRTSPSRSLVVQP
jgi:hypothetical protein